MAKESLDRSPKKNWVEAAGGLPQPIVHMAKDIHEEKGVPISQAIAIAISQAKKLAAKGNAKYIAAVAAWEKMKAAAKAKGLRESPDALDVLSIDAYELSDEDRAVLDVLGDGVVESPLTMTIEVGDLSLLEVTAGQSLSQRAQTRSGSSTDFNTKHPRGRGGSFTIKQGASGEDVRTVQRRVGAKADGSFGAMTKQAVMAFQAKHGLQVDGVVGHQTATALAGHYDAAKTAKVGGLKGSDRAKLSSLRKPASNAVRESADGALAMTFDVGDLSLLESFNPRQARDRMGRWRAQVGGLKVGESASLPDGVKVHRAGATDFHISAPGGQTGRLEGHGAPLAKVSSADHAATLAAQRSAQSDHPQSLGGTTRHSSLNDLARSDANAATMRQHMTDKLKMLSVGQSYTLVNGQGRAAGHVKRTANGFEVKRPDTGRTRTHVTAGGAALDADAGERQARTNEGVRQASRRENIDRMQSRKAKPSRSSTADRTGASQRVSQLRGMSDDALKALEGKGTPLEQKQVATEMARRGIVPQSMRRKKVRESAVAGALALRLDSDMRLVVDDNAIRESFDLAVVDGHGALSLVEAAVTPDALFNADGTIDFVILRPCHGRGIANAIYDADMLRENAHVFAGWPVYDNHESPQAARARQGIPRPPSELAGEIRESWFDNDFSTPNDAAMGFDRGGVIGRFMLTEDMEKVVRRIPRVIKTSVNAQATGKRPVRRNGKMGMLVEGIVNDPENCSVDLVTKAGAGGEVAALYREMARAA